MGNFTDRVLTCCDCGEEFDFPATQQQHFEKLGFKSDPKRCPECRARRKRENPRGQDRGGQGVSGGPREQFSVTCAECGKPATVPFKPTGNRPVYCSACFQSKR